MAYSEFELIRLLSQESIKNRPDVMLGIGDDAALLNVPAGMQLVVSMDTLVHGVHFPESTTPYNIGFKSLAVNLSDMAAMGAEPAWATLSLTLPEADSDWLQEFCRGFFSLANHFGVQLIGGDTTRGPLSATVQMHGFVPEGQALRRDAARVGDLIYVTGTLGDAGIALSLLGQEQNEIDHCYLLERLERPSPRIATGLMLRSVAHAAIDISDGLLADLQHICQASGVGATINVDALPLSTAYKSVMVLSDLDDPFSLPLSAGDDYELCFTVSPDNVSKLHQQENTALTCIGTIEHEAGLRCVFKDKEFLPSVKGYDHFSELNT